MNQRGIKLRPRTRFLNAPKAYLVSTGGTTRRWCFGHLCGGAVSRGFVNNELGFFLKREKKEVGFYVQVWLIKLLKCFENLKTIQRWNLTRYLKYFNRIEKVLTFLEMLMELQNCSKELARIKEVEQTKWLLTIYPGSHTTTPGKGEAIISSEHSLKYLQKVKQWLTV